MLYYTSQKPYHQGRYSLYSTFYIHRSIKITARLSSNGDSRACFVIFIRPVKIHPWDHVHQVFVLVVQQNHGYIYGKCI